MDISAILRGLLDIIEQGQSEGESDCGCTEPDCGCDDELGTPEVSVEEVPLPSAQQEFDNANPECVDDELDAVKRNAGLPVMVISTDGPMA